MKTAILVDGEFFLKRYKLKCGNNSPRKVATDLHKMCLSHLNQKEGDRRLYRIFFYDCPPLMKKAHNPISGKSVDFSKTPTALWRNDFHDELLTLRKVALRLGYLNERNAHWTIRPDKLKLLFERVITLDELGEEDVFYSVRQKGVDMRIGLDIASISYKKQVNQIILISGDSDFVSAAKLARREGMDFVLDNMGAAIRKDLHEHVDGIQNRLNFLQSLNPKQDQDQIEMD